MTATQAQAILVLCDAITSAVATAGSDGAPAGILFAALSAQGATLAQFDGIMSALVAGGRLRKAGQRYFLALGDGANKP